MFQLFQIVLMFALFSLLVQFIKNRYARIIFSSIGGLCTTLETTSVYLTGTFVDYRFYSYLNMDHINNQGYQFQTEKCFFLLTFALLSYLLYTISTILQECGFLETRILIPLMVTVLLALCIPHGIIHNIYAVTTILNTEDKCFLNALADLNIPQSEYITPEMVYAAKGKNIIVISIESLEQGFFGEDFKHLTPYLSTLTRKWTYYNQMPILPGGRSTASSLYCHQVGVPAFFKRERNSFFQNVTKTKLTGLGHVLGKAGYDCRYVVGMPGYAGMSDFLETYGISIVSEDDCIGTYPTAICGLNDKDLFEEAKSQISELNKDANRPFAIFLSTINTHFPDGILDERMKKCVPQREINLEFCVSATDYLIRNFIHYLAKENILQNTAVFIFPDHNLMGTTGPTIEKLERHERQGYLITNVKENLLPRKTKDALYQIDLPKMIINGAEIETNAKFLSDFIEGNDYLKYLSNNRKKLTALNTASLTRDNYKSGLNCKTIGKSLIISSGSIEVSYKFSTESEPDSKDAIIVMFNNEMEIIHQRRCNFTEAFIANSSEIRSKYISLIIRPAKTQLYTYIGNKHLIGMFKEGPTVQYSADEIQNVINSNNLILPGLKTLVPDKPLPKRVVPDISITSCKYISSQKISSKIKTRGNSFHLKRGLNLLTIDDDGVFHVENFDTWQSSRDAIQFVKTMKPLIKSGSFWAVASHDAVNNNYPNFIPPLKRLGFRLLPTLNGRIAYIAHSTTLGQIEEFSHPTFLQRSIASFGITTGTK